MGRIGQIVVAILLTATVAAAQVGEFPGNEAGVIASICDVPDVSCSSLSNGQLLIYGTTAGAFVNKTISGDCSLDYEGVLTCAGQVYSHSTDCTAATCDASRADDLCFEEDDNVLYVCESDGTPSWVVAGGGGGGTSEEAIEDYVGTMVAGNTESCISVAYSDGGTAGEGVLNFVVAVDNTCITSVDQSKITSKHAGTDLTADLEEETHAAEHADGQTDEVAVTAGMVNAGAGASASTFFRGDNTWATPTDTQCDDSGACSRIMVDTTTCQDISGDRYFHDTNCNASKDAGERWVDATCMEDDTCTAKGSHANLSGATIAECDGTIGGCYDEFSCNSEAISTEDQGICMGGTLLFEGSRCSVNADCSGGSICTAGDIYRRGITCDGRWEQRNPDGSIDRYVKTSDLPGITPCDPGESYVGSTCANVHTQAEADVMFDTPQNFAAGSTYDGFNFCYDTGSGCGSTETDTAALAAVAAHIAATPGAHAASAISSAASGGLVATNVEDALDELDTEKSATAHTHNYAGAATPGGNATNADALEGTDLGTLTDGKGCAYDSAGTEIDCDKSYLVSAAGTVDIQDDLKDSDCNDGEIPKKSGGLWGCGTDTDSTNAAGQPNTMYVCWGAHGTDQAVASGGGTLSEPLRTLQYAVNRVTEQGDPADWIIELCAGLFSEDAETFPIRMWNTDTSSAQYGKALAGTTIRGQGDTVVKCDYTVQTEGCATAIDLTGAASVRIEHLTADSNGGPAVSSLGGSMLTRTAYVGIVGVGNESSQVRFRGIGNNAVGFDYTTTFSGEGANDRNSSIWYEVGSKPGAANGFCMGAAWRGGSCVDNTDCGGTCNSASSPTGAIGAFCATNADCGVAGLCTFGSICKSESLDEMWLNGFTQTGSSGYSQFVPRLCAGGATALTVGTSIAVSSTATCTATDCGLVAGTSDVCDTNTDCRRYVVGVGTNFDPEVAEGETILVNGGQERSVLRRWSDTLLEVTEAYGTTYSGTVASTSNDGWPCSVNADCDTGVTTGECTPGTGGKFEEHMNNHVMLSGGAGGYCGDASGYVFWPPTPCDMDDDFCQSATPCDQNSDCVAEVCNVKTGFCRNYTRCDIDAECSGGRTCPAECGAHACVNYGVYVEGTGSQLQLRDATLTATDIYGSSRDNPDYQVYAANGGEVEMQGGSVEVEGTSMLADELKEVGGTVSAKAIVSGEFLNATKALRLKPQASDPTTPTEGYCWWDDTAAQEECYDGTATRRTVTDTGTQTLTNKTLTSPVMTNPSIGDGTPANQYVTVNGAGFDPQFGYEQSLTYPAIQLAGNPVLAVIGQAAGGFTSVIAYDSSEVVKWSIIGGTTGNMNVRRGGADGSFIVSDDDGTMEMECDELDASSRVNYCNFPVGITEGSSGTAVKVKGILTECTGVEKLGGTTDVNIPIFTAPDAAVTIIGAGCGCTSPSGATCASTLARGDLEAGIGTTSGAGDEAMAGAGAVNLQCTSQMNAAIAYAAVTNDTTSQLVAGESVRFDVDTAPTNIGTDTYTFCVKYVYQ